MLNPTLHILKRSLALLTSSLLFAPSALAQTNQIAQPYLIIALLALMVVGLALALYKIWPLYTSNKQQVTALARQLEESEIQNRKNTPPTELLNNIFETSLHGIIACTALRDERQHVVDFRFDKVNKRAGKIMGYSVAESVGKRMLSLFPGNIESGLFDSYKQVALTGQAFSTTIYYQHDGLDTWFLISAAKNGDGIIITFSDVSELKSNEQRLLISKQELKDVNAELEQFAYIASHDLKEPLRKIRAFGDRLASGFSKELGETGQDYIARMQNAASRMQVLIDDLLNYSRTAKGTSQFEHSIHLNTLCDSAIALLDESIDEKKAHIVIPELGLIDGDKTQLTQLFLNIFSNSLKYTKTNAAPKIQVSSEIVSKTDGLVKVDYCEITIKDNGIGFDNEHKEKIFEIFQRLHGRSQYEGTGIGLAICQKIVSNHRGYIHAYCDLKTMSENGGATFVVGLPITRAG